MKDYWQAVKGKVGEAAFDILFVAVVSLLPLLFGRLVLIFGPRQSQESYWAFLTNGQLTLYSMSSLATLLLFCLRKKLPDAATIWMGAFAISCLLFLMVLVGVDPALQANSFSFVGPAALSIYVLTILLRILADAMKGVEAKSALEAGTESVAKTEAGLKQRKLGG